MGGKSPFYFAAMDSNTIIGKTQHVRHRCIVEIGNMVFILLHNGEGAQRSRLVIGPIKNDGGPYFIAGVENRECLCGKINGDDHGTIRNSLVVPTIKIGRAHVSTTVTNAHLVYRLHTETNTIITHTTQ